MKSNIAGVFVKIAFADQVDILLQHHSPDRPAARFNRVGENALYLSGDELSARIAMRKYAANSDSPRVLVQYEVDECQLVDFRHVDAKELRLLASSDWQEALKDGREPTSWQVADKLRASNEAGLIDPSRKNPEIWHVTLLRWNEPGAPRVRMVGQPTAISI